MKKFYIFIFVLLMSSCSDWLQLQPESELIREEYWRTGNDVEGVVSGIYKEMAGTVVTCFKWGELRADEFVPGSRISLDDRNIMTGSIYPENSLTQWAGFYRAINFANTVIHFAPLVVERDQTFTMNESKAYQAEALFLRSLAYFYLVRTFRDVPLVLDASISDAQDYYPAKVAESVIIDQIIQDLKTAITSLPTSYGKLEYDKGRATKASAQALLADVYLWSEKYQECITYCNELIASGQFALIDGEDWFSNFFPGNSNESIFEIQFDRDLNQLNQLYSITAPYPEDGTYPDGDDEFRFSPYMVELFKKNEGDRRAGSKTYLPFDLRYNQYILWKYIGTSSSEYAMTPRQGNRESDANWIVYRYADILLMKAEASNELGDFTTAALLLNQIRKRAGIGNVSESPNRFLVEESILDERAREFAGEGKRWYDLIRLGRRNEFERKDKFISILTANKSIGEKEILKSKYSNPDSWFLPIYQNEIEQNNKLKQNPYYVNQ
jgi:starch-binding outer membrane protein, SusD/RagB family